MKTKLLRFLELAPVGFFLCLIQVTLIELLMERDLSPGAITLTVFIVFAAMAAIVGMRK